MNKKKAIFAALSGKDDALFSSFHSSLGELREEPVASERALLIYCLGGTALVSVDGQDYDVGPYSSLFIFPQKGIWVRSATPDFQTRCLTFSSAILNEAATNLSSALLIYIHQHPLIAIDEPDRGFVHAMNRLMRHTQRISRQVYKEKIIANLLCNFLLIQYGTQPIEEVEAEQQHSRAEELFKRFMANVEMRMMQTHSVKEHADQLCISSKHLTVIVRQKTGKSPKEIIDEVVLRRVLNLLKNTSKSIKEISIECGFPNSSYFTRFVRRTVGMTPQEYRQSS